MYYITINRFINIIIILTYTINFMESADNHSSLSIAPRPYFRLSFIYG